MNCKDCKYKIAQEQAEGMLKERPDVVEKTKCSLCNGKGFYTKSVFHGKPFTTKCNHCEGGYKTKKIPNLFNQAISIAQTILAKKILECDEKDKEIECSYKETKKWRFDAQQMYKELQSLKSKLTVENVIKITKRYCSVCNGTGKEICDNPDHGFISAMPGDTSRLGCPVCGHDEDHAVPNSTCEQCKKRAQALIKELGVKDEM